VDVGGTPQSTLHPGEHQVVDHAAGQHLADLAQCDEHGQAPGHLEAGRPRCVVGVHERVDQVVHGHEPAAARHHVLVGVPGVQQHRDVVVPVEEDETLLPQDDEEGVAWRRRRRGESEPRGGEGT